MELLTECTRCGQQWQPDHSDFVRGVWRVCPVCRGDPQDSDVETDPSRHHGAIRPLHVDSAQTTPEEAA